MQTQTLIAPRETKLARPYSTGFYNKCNKTEQWIRISEGCPHQDPFCYEPCKIKWFGIPEILRNKVKIMDMNFLCKPEALHALEVLGSKEVNEKVVHYEFICGIDYRFLTLEIAEALKKARFEKIRLAWDWHYRDQLKIRDAIYSLVKVGYPPDSLMVFMICNWRIPYKENLNKLDLLKVWNVKVADCYYDNQTSPHIVPIFWTDEQNKDFRKKCRHHNLIVNFKMDPQIPKQLI